MPMSCENPAHDHGKGRAEMLASMAISLPGIMHGGYLVYESEDQDGPLFLGTRLTSDLPGQGRAVTLLPVFLMGIQTASAEVWDGQDPQWELVDGTMIRPVGFLVKHRAGALRMRRFRPFSQGAVLALRDRSLRYGYRQGKNVVLALHDSGHDPQDCFCGVYLSAVETMWPTYQEPV